MWPTNNRSQANRVKSPLTPDENQFRKEGIQAAGPQTLIVGDLGVKDMRDFCGIHTKVLYFPGNRLDHPDFHCKPEFGEFDSTNILHQTAAGSPDAAAPVVTKTRTWII